MISKIITTATNEIGYSETPPHSNKTKYGKWFGLDGLPWCGIFVSWVYHKAGFPLGNIGFLKGFAGCQTAVAYFKKNNQITTNPQPGDIVFFDFNNDGRFDHVGIFIKKIDQYYFEAIEGNTSFNNQTNGGTVMLRRRTFYNSLFVRPACLALPSPTKKNIA